MCASTRPITLTRTGRNNPCRVQITGGFRLIMAWLNYCDTDGVLPLTLCAAAVHEFGHLAVIRLAGGRVHLLRLTAAGAELRLDGTLSYGRELLCALAGPAVNLVLGFYLARVGWPIFAGLNLVLGLFNLLPLRALDGGRALGCLAALLPWSEQAESLLCWLDILLTAVSVLCGLLVLLAGGNATLLLVGMWLLGSFWGKRRKVDGKRGCQPPFKRVK